MALFRMYIEAGDTRFCVEANPDDSGIRFGQVTKNGIVWVATIIDEGNEFCLSTLRDNGIYIEKFNPTAPLIYKDGSTPPYRIPEELEVFTPHNRRIFVRSMYKNTPEKGVIIGYAQNMKLYTLAFCGAGYNRIDISTSR